MNQSPPHSAAGAPPGDATKFRARPDWLAAALQRLTRINPYLVLLLVVFYFATVRIVQFKYPMTFSFAPNVIWSNEWAEQFRRGNLYPRWMEHPYSGLGTPTFQFYGPICMYATLPFSVGLGLNVSASVLYAFWTALFVLGFGMVRLCDTVFQRTYRWLSVVIAIMAMLSPYNLLNIYSRGALAETWATAILPWFLSALLRSLDSPARSARVGLVIFAALYALCHPPSLLVGSIAIGFGLLVISRNWADFLVTLRRGILPIGAGFAVAGLYLFPAIRDQQYVNIQFLTNGGGPPASSQMLATEIGRWSFKFPDGYMGSIIPSILFMVLAILGSCWMLRRHGDLDGQVRTRGMVLLAAAAAAAVMMMTDLGGGLYALFRPLNTIQFTARWMVVLIVCAMPLWGHIILLSMRGKGQTSTILRIPIWLATIWMSTNAFSTTMTYVDWNLGDARRTDGLFAKMHSAGREADLSATPINRFRDLLYTNAKDELVCADVNEYQPFPKSEGQFPPRTFDYVEWQQGEGTVSGIQWNQGHRHFTVDTPTGGRLLLRTSAWLGWQISVNGNTSPGDEPGDWGRMVVKVPPGHSEVTVDYRGTPNQHLGKAISIVALLLLIAYGFWPKLRLRFAQA